MQINLSDNQFDWIKKAVIIQKYQPLYHSILKKQKECFKPDNEIANNIIFDSRGEFILPIKNQIILNQIQNDCDNFQFKSPKDI